VFWISRPPYARWTAIGLLIVVSLWFEVRPDSVVLHPFLVRDVAVGEPVEEAIRWEQIPSGTLTATRGTGFAARPLSVGEPLLASDTTALALTPPDGWWVVELDLPSDAVAGAAIQLVILPEPGTSPLPPVGGIIMSVREPDRGFGSGGLIGSVAVPPDQAATAAVAIANDRVSVLIQYPD